MGAGLGSLASSAATIVGHVSKLVESSVNLMDKGIRWADYGVDELEKLFKHKPNPTDLDEYADMSDVEIGKNQPKSSIPELQTVINYQVRMSYLKYKQTELQMFYGPVVKERIRIGKELDVREALESSYAAELAELNANIKDDENKLKDPKIRSQMSEDDINNTMFNLAKYKSDRQIKLDEVAKITMWNKPELVKTTSPAGKNPQKYEYRFKANPDKSQSAKVDLETLYYKILPRHAFKLKMKMEEYEEEMARLGFQNFLAIKNLIVNHPAEMATDGAWRKELGTAGSAIYKNLSDAEAQIGTRMIDADPKHNISLVDEAQKGSQPVRKPSTNIIFN